MNARDKAMVDRCGTSLYNHGEIGSEDGHALLRLIEKLDRVAKAADAHSCHHRNEGRWCDLTVALAELNQEEP